MQLAISRLILCGSTFCQKHQAIEEIGVVHCSSEIAATAQRMIGHKRRGKGRPRAVRNRKNDQSEAQGQGEAEDRTGAGRQPASSDSASSSANLGVQANSDRLKSDPALIGTDSTEQEKLAKRTSAMCIKTSDNPSREVGQSGSNAMGGTLLNRASSGSRTQTGPVKQGSGESSLEHYHAWRQYRNRIRELEQQAEADQLEVYYVTSHDTAVRKAHVKCTGIRNDGTPEYDVTCWVHGGVKGIKTDEQKQRSALRSGRRRTKR